MCSDTGKNVYYITGQVFIFFTNKNAQNHLKKGLTKFI
jgi:hypothetical protein